MPDFAELSLEVQLEKLNEEGLVILQPLKGYRFSLDAILLARFAVVQEAANIIDLGTGSGIIPLLLTASYKRLNIMGVEIQTDLAEIAKKSVEINKLTEQITIVNCDLKELAPTYYEKFDLVVSNPPFFKKASGKLSDNAIEAIARHELCCTLEDIIFQGARLLKPKGKLSLIHRPERLNEVFTLLDKYKLSPTKLCFVHPHEDKAATMFLLEATKGTKQNLKVIPPLFVYDLGGNYTAKMNKIYAGEGIRGE